MNMIFDPIWPWSSLTGLLARGGLATGLAAVGLALLAAVVPVVLSWRPAYRWLVLGGLLGLMLLLFRSGWVAGGVGLARAGPVEEAFALLGVGLLIVLPGLLVGISLATYLSAPGLSRWRQAFVLGLRLLAFALTFLAILRPSLASYTSNRPRSVLFVLLDLSRSMTVVDEKLTEKTRQSRWDLVKKLLPDWAAVAEGLRDQHQIDVEWFGFSDRVAPLDPLAPGEATGPRTDTARALRELADRRDAGRRCLGLWIVSDGADNGATPALGEVARWRTPPCPIFTFGCGQTITKPAHNDVAITSITTEPTPFVPLGGTIRVRLNVDAHGFEGQKVRFRVFLEPPPAERTAGQPLREVESAARTVTLSLTRDNAVELSLQAPEHAGEYRLKVVAEPPPGDEFPANNSAETFVTVSREGIRVLLFDKPRVWEPQLICDALADDNRVRVTPVWLRGQTAGGDPALARIFNFQDNPPDVIILGDITAKQLRGLDPRALEKIVDQVGKGTGLLMLGGYSSLGNGDWADTPLANLLPIDLTKGGQIESEVEVRMVPTEDGLQLARFLFTLDTGDPKTAWQRLPPLQGASELFLHKPRRGDEAVLAMTDKGEPLMVMRQHYQKAKAGQPAGPFGRVVAFGADTTHRWVTDEEGQRKHSRFWRQLVVWLARQENATGGVWIKPDTRRLPVHGELGFQVGLRGRGGANLPGGRFSVEVLSPEGAKSPVAVAQGPAGVRGVFKDTGQPGVYEVVVQGEGQDPDGKAVAGKASARVTVYDQDLEMLRPAADEEFLKKLANAGGGEFHRVGDLKGWLERLAEQPEDPGRVKVERRPDWRSTARSPFLMLFFLAFVVVVSLEWFLRRRWGLV
jgi:uncharacterized membrane protein